MIKIEGKYGEIIVYSDYVEPSAMGQLYGVANHPISENAKIRIMPDVHAGSGCTIGYTATLTDKVCPALVGVDIGCGIVAYNIGPQEINFKEFDTYLRVNIPAGFKIHEHCPNNINQDLEESVKDVCGRLNLVDTKVLKALGTLGGGNHFIELNQDPSGNIWITIHSGSRKFGLDIATNYQKRAAAYATVYNPNKELAWLRNTDRTLYLEDVRIAQQYAAVNRRIMLEKLLEYFKVKLNLADVISDKCIVSVHNYIDLGAGILRKGAIAAAEAQKVIIPLNMRDGSIVGTGKGNADWNYSAPHGAGRAMSRGDAKRKLSLEEYRNQMQGIWSSCIKQSTLDEAPMAYKNAESIIEQAKETIDIDFVMTPIYNFKASE